MTDINKELKEALLAQLKKEFGQNVTYSAMELYDIASPLIDKHLPKGSVVVEDEGDSDRLFSLIQLHECGDYAEVVVRRNDRMVVYAGNIDKQSNPKQYS